MRPTPTLQLQSPRRDLAPKPNLSGVFPDVNLANLVNSVHTLPEADGSQHRMSRHTVFFSCPSKRFMRLRIQSRSAAGAPSSGKMKRRRVNQRCIAFRTSPGQCTGSAFPTFTILDQGSSVSCRGLQRHLSRSITPRAAASRCRS